jgi:hypothetical protein
MHKGFADEAIVIVKRPADEDMVTYLRIKPVESARTAEMKGGTC